METTKKNFKSLSDRELAELTLATNLIIIRKIDHFETMVKRHQQSSNIPGRPFATTMGAPQDYGQDFVDMFDYKKSIDDSLAAMFKD